MNSITARVGSKALSETCAEELRPQAEWLCHYLRKAFNDGAGLRDGLTIRVGWSVLTPSERMGRLVVCEPDYGGDPFAARREDLTCSLRVLAQQNDLVALTDAGDGAPARFDERVTLAEGCLAVPRVYPPRQPAAFAGDSGWYIGPVEGRGGDLSSIYVYQLVALRPALMEALALPVGYIVTFNGDELEGWRNEG